MFDLEKSQPDRPGNPSRRGAYEPPRIEVLGTIEELTMGFASPEVPDNTTSFGSTISDRRLKNAIELVDSRALLRRVAAVLEYEPPRIEVLGTIEELTRGGTNPLADTAPFFGSGTVTSDRRLKEEFAPLDPRDVLERVSACSGSIAAPKEQPGGAGSWGRVPLQPALPCTGRM